jgi:peroxiredoxin
MQGTQQKIRMSKVVEILLWLAALGVLAENILLFLQNRHLSEALAPQITAGTQLQMLAGLSLDGRPVQVTLPGSGSNLLVITFSPGCPACQANQDRWMELVSALEQKGVRVLWVSRDPIEITRDYCANHGIPLSDVLADPPYRTFAQLGLARVPNTLLVGAGGRVEKVWAGRLDHAGWDTMFTYFGERQEIASPLQSRVSANPTSCAPELPQTSVKTCK